MTARKRNLVDNDMLAGANRPDYILDVEGTRILPPIMYPSKIMNAAVNFNYVSGHRYPQARWAICPQHLFVPALRDFLLARTGRNGVWRTAEPVCGTMEIDVAGTAQGMWVLEGQNVTFSATTHDRFFALALHDLHADTHQVLVTTHASFRRRTWGTGR